MMALKYREFAEPSELCSFVNHMRVQVVSITKMDWCFTLFYRDKDE